MGRRTGVRRPDRRRRLRRLLSAVISLLIVAGCSADPGGDLLRPTPQAVYERWLRPLVEPLNAFSRAQVAAINRLREADGAPDRATADDIVTDLQVAARALATAVADRAYPGGRPLPDEFPAGFAGLLRQIDQGGERWHSCSRACGQALEDVITAGNDAWLLAVALADFGRLASPLTSRRHRIEEGLLTAESVGQGWQPSEIAVASSAALCRPDQRRQPEPTETTTALLSRGTAVYVEHTVERFSEPGAAEQGFNALRLQAALCRHQPPRGDQVNRSWELTESARFGGLPAIGWRTTVHASRTLRLETRVILVADTLIQLSVVAAQAEPPIELLDSLSEQALAAMLVEVPA